MNGVNVSPERPDRLTSDNVNAIHDTTGDRFPSVSNPHICAEIKMFCDAGTGGTIHSNSMNLGNKKMSARVVRREDVY